MLRKMKMPPALVALLLLLTLTSSSLGADVTLSSVNDFTDFVGKVNSGSDDYYGTTVYLDSDITLPEGIDPIGNSYNYYFNGVLDGQGHVISNLTISSTSQFAGLFGYSDGMTIRNAVLDSSCSIESTFNGLDYVFVGGIIGMCEMYSDQCIIENIVNMAGVTFSGSTSDSYHLFFGGIVGSLYSFSSYCNAYVKNCVNYGSVTDSGTVSGSDTWAELGGLVGTSEGESSSTYAYIQNCLNYGAIIHNGTSANLIVGGIVGNVYKVTYIENCVSAGKISMQTEPSYKNIGSIVADVQSITYINYCYYTSDVGVSNLYYYIDFTPNITETPDTPTDVDSDLVNKLNINATSCNWNNWFMLHLNGGSINNLTQELLVEIQGQIPNPVKEGNSFLYWCNDTECTEEFDPATDLIDGITDIYAGWTPNNYTVSFNFGNGTTVNETFTYNTEIVYPEMKKEGYTLSWDNYHELIPAGDITVTAQWTPNNYTVTFDANGGSVSETSKIVTFNEKYGNLPEPKKEGHMFLGWFTNEANGTEVTNETFVTTPYNHILYAHWEEVTTQVEIVFSTKDLTEKDIEEIIKQYTRADFDIVKVEGEPGETRVIIKFTDTQSAEEFVRKVRTAINTGANNFKRIEFTSEDNNSFSPMLCPALLLNALLL